MYKLVFFVPESHCEKVKAAVFTAGAGKIGSYDNCSWQVLGQGQFLPQKNSQPFIGELNALEKIPEYRVEMVCDDRCIEQVINSLKEAHPYEEPAYDLWKIEVFE